MAGSSSEVKTNNNEHQQRQKDFQHSLSIDAVLATQPELGPSVSDGGYGWIIFGATLYFRIACAIYKCLIPNLIITYGIFLALIKLEIASPTSNKIFLWDEKLVYVPLVYSITSNVFDALCLRLITKSTWPRLVATAGNCLICAGLLFMWLGLSLKANHSLLFVFSGAFAGIGSALQLSQCDVLLSQYFRLKLRALTHISQLVTAIGAIVTPIILGHHIITNSILHIILWYQAIILWGLIVNISFRKPMYLKSQQRSSYQFVDPLPDDEEQDIFSKNSRELQIKQQGNDGSTTTMTTISTIRENWVQFEEETQTTSTANNNASTSSNPTPLFSSSDTPVNYNSTYSYDEEDIFETPKSSVFLPNPVVIISHPAWDVLKQPTFYKTLLTAITIKYTIFVFYTLFPTYLYLEIEGMHIRKMSEIVGLLGLTTFVYFCFSFWLNVVNKQTRAMIMWVMFWIGSAGFLMIGESENESVVIMGAVQVVLSITVLQHIGSPILGASYKGEMTQEHQVLSILSGLAFTLFLVINISFKTCFTIMSLLHFFTGLLWIMSFIYKKIFIR